MKLFLVLSIVTYFCLHNLPCNSLHLTPDSAQLNIQSWTKSFSFCSYVHIISSSQHLNSKTSLEFLATSDPLVLTQWDHLPNVNTFVQKSARIRQAGRYLEHCRATLFVDLKWESKPLFKILYLNLPLIRFSGDVALQWEPVKYIYIITPKKYLRRAHAYIRDSLVHEIPTFDSFRLSYIVIDYPQTEGKFTFYCIYAVCYACRSQYFLELQFSPVLSQETPEAKLKITDASERDTWMTKDTVKEIQRARARSAKDVPYVPKLFRDDSIVNLLAIDKPPRTVARLYEIITTRFSNASLKLEHNFERNPKGLKKYMYVIQKVYPSFVYQSPMVYFSNPMPIQTDYFNFVTCHNHLENIRLQVFLQPFKLKVWTYLALTILCLSLIFWKLLFRKAGFFFNLLLVTSILMEIFTLPAELRRTPKVVFRLFICMALLASIILSTCYKGKLTFSVTAPLPQRPYSKFAELQHGGFDLYSPIASRFVDYTQTREIWAKTLDVFRSSSSLGENPEVSATEFGLKVFLTNQEFNLLFGKDVAMSKFNPNTTHINQLVHMIRFPANFPDVTMDQVVSECGKSAFIGYESSLGAFRPGTDQHSASATYARNKTMTTTNEKKVFSKGQDQLFKEDIGWVFVNDHKGGSYLSSFFRRMAIESGLFNWLEHRLPAMRRDTLAFVWAKEASQSVKNRPESLSMTSNLIASLLFFWVCLVCVSGVVLGLERLASLQHSHSPVTQWKWICMQLTLTGLSWLQVSRVGIRRVRNMRGKINRRRPKIPVIRIEEYF